VSLNLRSRLHTTAGAGLVTRIMNQRGTISYPGGRPRGSAKASPRLVISRIRAFQSLSLPTGVRESPSTLPAV